MTARLFPRRDLVAWTIGFLAISTLLVVTGFTSDDPDSALYADQAARLAAEPVARWIAPEWWGNWDHHGLFREHPVGILLVPTVLASAGIPGVQAAYITGIAAGLLSVLLIGALVARVTSVADARAVMWLIQLMPLAFIFRIRANHEYPMLVCLLLAIVGVDAVRRSWRWVWVTPLALSVAVLVKAAFVAVPLLAIGWWALVNPSRTPGGLGRPIAAGVLSVVAVVAMSVAYDGLYLRVTGEGFWAGYWARQFAPFSIDAQPADQPGMLHHLGFYVSRALWHPAPWSLALVAAAWRLRRQVADTWRGLPPSTRRGLVFVLAFAASTILLLTPAVRFAERYIFSANYALAAAGIVVALHQWPRLRDAAARLDARVPALPALCWTVLMLLRLLVGPLLPRISA